MATIADLEPEGIKHAQVFFPLAFERSVKVAFGNHRFVHYTSADTARRIIENEEIWMRKSALMNDFRELEHGLDCINHALAVHRDRYRGFFESIWPGFCDELQERFNSWLPHMRDGTYIACISEHADAEDRTGRLSMWRAYCGRAGIALVVSGAPFVSVSNALKAYTSPVAYLREDGFAAEFEKFLAGIEGELQYVRSLTRERLIDSVFEVFRYAMLCTKHPGFQEEREWRVIYSPRLGVSDRIVEAVETIGGVPQLIQKIPLKDVPDEGLTGIQIPDFLDRIIIGPTDFPFEIGEAFASILEKKGVKEPWSKIVTSDIPLRQG